MKIYRAGVRINGRKYFAEGASLMEALKNAIALAMAAEG